MNKGHLRDFLLVLEVPAYLWMSTHMDVYSGSAVVLRLCSLGMGSRAMGSEIKSRRQGSGSGSVPSSFSVPQFPPPHQLEMFLHPSRE